MAYQPLSQKVAARMRELAAAQTAVDPNAPPVDPNVAPAPALPDKPASHLFREPTYRPASRTAKRAPGMTMTQLTRQLKTLQRKPRH